MLKTRLIPTLLFKDYSLVKSVKFADYRMVGNPIQSVRVYNARNVDELIFLDIAASDDGRDPLFTVIEEIANECFMPLTVGGGIRTIDHIRHTLQVGADKVAINTAALKNPLFISEASTKFGKQAIVVSIDVFQKSPGIYKVRTSDKTHTLSLELGNWLKQVEKLGAGEILLTSIDRDGTMTGYDIELIKLATQTVTIPMIASGGAGIPQHCIEAIKTGGAAAVAAASIFHFTQYTPYMIKKSMNEAGIPVRLLRT